jgi:1,4-dihydroxy-6-naphthoate synthase
MLIRIAHSPDPDDAFMFYGLSSGAIRADGFTFEHILDDIQTLNERAMRGVYEVSAISIHAYPYVADHYALMACGSSMGDGYGPMIVTQRPMTVQQLRGKRIAVPGKMTTAYLALQLMLGTDNFTPKVVMFDEISAEVKSGQSDAGLLIHEGQITYQREGLHLVTDLGVWWERKTGLPLPLGGNVVRRDLGEEICLKITQLIRESIKYSLAHREEAVQYALRFGRGLDLNLADKFVGMYVNDWTVDYGERGREAVRRLLTEGATAGIVPPVADLRFIG